MQILKLNPTDLDVAREMSFKYGRQLSPASDSSTAWWAWDRTQHKWVRCDADVARYYATNTLEQLILNCAGDTEEEDRRRRKALEGLNTASGIENIIRRYRTLAYDGVGYVKALDDSNFDADVDILNLKNGILHVSTGVFIPNDLEFYQNFNECRERYAKLTSEELDTSRYRCSLQAGTKYVHGATCPTFNELLNDVFIDEKGNPDSEKIGYFWRWLKYALTGRNDRKAFDFWRSVENENGHVANNGKSTLKNIVMALLGDYAVEIPAHLVRDINGGGDRPSPQLLGLRGRRVVFIQELPKNTGDLTDFLKTVTGGDRIHARQMFASRAVEFNPTFKIVVTSNYAYRLNLADDSMMSRLVYTEFRAQFLGPDRYDANNKVHRPVDMSRIQKIIAEELPGILNRALAASDDLTVPTSMKTVDTKLKYTSSIVYDFMNDELSQTNTDTGLTYEVLYEAFQRYCWQQGLRTVPTIRQFLREMRQICANVPDWGGLNKWKGASFNEQVWHNGKNGKGVKGILFAVAD